MNYQKDYGTAARTEICYLCKFRFVHDDYVPFQVKENGIPRVSQVCIGCHAIGNYDVQPMHKKYEGELRSILNGFCDEEWIDAPALE